MPNVLVGRSSEFPYFMVASLPSIFSSLLVFYYGFFANFNLSVSIFIV